MVEQSPFPHHGPLLPAEVTGRDELARDLAQRLTGRKVTALLGPRRYGKTSLLRRVTADLADTVDAETIWIDLYELSSIADLAGAFDRSLSGAPSRVRQTLESIVGSFSLQLGVIGVELTKTRRDRPDPVLVLRRLLQSVVAASERHNLILVLDEFSGIAGVDHAAGILRTELQHHYRDLSIVFAGSQPSTMRLLFADQAQPFFAQADLVEIGPLGADEVIGIVESGFERTGRDAGTVAPRIATIADGHPQRAMQLADAVWWQTPEGGVADDPAWERALGIVRLDVDQGSERLFALLPAGHQKTLRVIASGGSVHGTAADVLALASGTATAAVEALHGNGWIARDDRGRLRIVDPLLADWIRRRFPV
jgi:uncharacterized protein